ncbi:unnamed protein product [Danaus chrysippus]|uniref:(African queen) hypothetical protein n=1 Tax=Danaus chrysippus TaxID=151541 RepID=A0A8J2QEW3_9NEOP|nr:unnamed protein product [Danaus chrysippus]
MDKNNEKICEKKLKAAEIKLNKILRKINLLKLNNYDISRIDLPQNKEGKKFIYFNGWLKNFAIFIMVFAGVIVSLWWHYSQFYPNCLIPLPLDSKSLFRSPEDCSMCVRVRDVIRLANITAEEFEEDYAYTTQPVIVTDATKHWKAIQEFSFDFFSKFYRTTKMGRKINECFYFAYKSGLNSLNEVFAMDERRVNLSGEPWYVGWSTCYEEETRALRQYYERPYFLPKTAESDMVDWIFMGGPGQGAHMHVDSVRHMSWQAQVRGSKTWQLAPPPECLYSCKWITFTVQPGDILVVDTNRWYHKTNVLPGDISITIGAEYD